jgi:hypothetical protein
MKVVAEYVGDADTQREALLEVRRVLTKYAPPAGVTATCDEPTFHAEPEEAQQARLARIVAILRHELPNILPEGQAKPEAPEVEATL